MGAGGVVDRYVILSRKHGLHHVGRWLAKEGDPSHTHVASLREPYHKRAWAGLLDRARLPTRKRGQRLEEWLGALPWAGELATGAAALLTDDAKVTQAAQVVGWPVVYGAIPTIGSTRSPIALGGWWTGDTLMAPHWAVRDWGLWPGGMGPAELGGVTLITGPRHPVELLEPFGDALRGAQFRGMVALDLDWDGEAKGWRSGALRAGWPPFHTHLWLWGQAHVGSALLGQPSASPAYLVAAPVSVPPYPFNAERGPVPIGTQPSQNGSHLVLFDVALEGGQLRTAGLDGLVALVCGRGATFAAAQRQAAVAVTGFAVAEAQFRPDTGASVYNFVADLEAAGWW